MLKRWFVQFLLAVFLLALAPLAAAAGKVVPQHPFSGQYEEWMGTYFKDKKLGFSFMEVDRKGDGYVVRTKVLFRLQSRGVDQSTTFTQETRLSKDLEIRSFDLLQELMGTRQRVQARAEGGDLVYRVTSTGFDKEDAADLPANLALSSTYLLNIMQAGLEVGKKGTLPIFVEPFQMVTNMDYEILRREEVEFEGGTVDAFVMRQRMSGLHSVLWITPGGRVVREVSRQGFESRNEPEEQATRLDEEAMSVSGLITVSLVKLDQPLEQARNTRLMRYRLAKLETADSIPQDHRQKVLSRAVADDGTHTSVLQVRTEMADPAARATLPVSLPDHPELLEDTPEVQSNHSQIRTLAGHLMEGVTDAWQAARRINKWVYSNLDKELVDSVTALDALRNRRGECQSHTYLFTAIARAAGIPTRIVNGLVYSRDYDGFLYHAWPEVYVGEWRALDPTLGQDHVDATHIKITAGPKDQSMKLMEFIGQVQIRVVER